MTRGRHITALVLLVSYLLASAAAWLHTMHVCGNACRAQVAANPGDDHMGCSQHGHCAGGAHDEAPVPHSSAWRERGDVPDVPERRDDCTVCRFQLCKKLMAEAPPPTLFSDVYPELPDLELPLCRVAPLQATPDGRAPPRFG